MNQGRVGSIIYFSPSERLDSWLKAWRRPAERDKMLRWWNGSIYNNYCSYVNVIPLGLLFTLQLDCWTIKRIHSSIARTDGFDPVDITPYSRQVFITISSDHDNILNSDPADWFVSLEYIMVNMLRISYSRQEMRWEVNAWFDRLHSKDRFWKERLEEINSLQQPSLLPKAISTSGKHKNFHVQG